MIKSRLRKVWSLHLAHVLKFQNGKGLEKRVDIIEISHRMSQDKILASLCWLTLCDMLEYHNLLSKLTRRSMTKLQVFRIGNNFEIRQKKIKKKQKKTSEVFFIQSKMNSSPFDC